MNNKKVSKIKFNKRQIWQVAFTAMTASALMAVDQQEGQQIVGEEVQELVREAIGQFKEEIHQKMEIGIGKIRKIKRIQEELQRIGFDLERLEILEQRGSEIITRALRRGESLFENNIAEENDQLLQELQLSYNGLMANAPQLPAERRRLERRHLQLSLELQSLQLESTNSYQNEED